MVSLHLRHRDDPAPALPPVPDLFVSREQDPTALAAVQGRPVDVLEERLAGGHHAYVAWVGWQPAAWGWVATRTAEIGELGLVFAIREGERYLWNFVTRREQRGRGIYPRLLNAIVAAESRHAERFWIIHAPENRASAAGIRKAGFTPVGALSFDPENRPAVASLDGDAAATSLLGVPASRGPLAPCWRCPRTGREWTRLCPHGACECDYQQPRHGCAS